MRELREGDVTWLVDIVSEQNVSLYYFTLSTYSVIDKSSFYKLNGFDPKVISYRMIPTAHQSIDFV